MVLRAVILIRRRFDSRYGKLSANLELSTMPSVFKQHFESALFTGDVSVNTGLFINGEFADSMNDQTIEYA